MRSLLSSLFIFTIIFSSCNRKAIFPYQIQKTAESKNGMVVTAHPISTQVGVDILEMGGSAVDAAIAVQFALTVVHPRAGNIGGGGFLVYRDQNGQIDCLDYREKAPAKAFKDMYLDSLKEVIPDLSIKGHLASGVPGSVAGFFDMHAKYGRLPFEKLIEPSINLARKGHRITQQEADRLNGFKDQFLQFNNTECPLIKEGKWEAGDIIVHQYLANTLETIKNDGRDGFYKGAVADAIVAEMKSGNGIITKEDLANYETKWRKPITTNYKEYKLISMPPSSSGGIVLAQMLEMIEPYSISDWGYGNAKSVHLMVEAERRAYADRAKFLGDMDFFDVPLDSMMQPSYILSRMADFEPEKATKSTQIAAGEFKLRKESFETTHLSIVDKEGNAASVTTTLNSNYGSKVWVDKGGFLMNNEMDDFSAKPGVMNQFGLIGAEANAIAPGKRMLSSMTPTIIDKNGDLFMILGTPGGSTIMTSVFQVFLNVAEFEMNITDAVHAKRFHHQWLPDEIMYEQGSIPTGEINALKEMGHTFREVNYIGKVEAILRKSDGTFIGAADNRGVDHAQGVK